MTMNLHSLTKTPGSKHRRKRVGRGESSGWGRTSGRGNKGQMSRSGHHHKPAFEGGQMRLIRRIPKRGFSSRNPVLYVPVNVCDLETFPDGAEVTFQALRQAGLAKGAAAGVKILGTGDLKKKLVVKVQAYSASARAKIEAAGGTCEVVE